MRWCILACSLLLSSCAPFFFNPEGYKKLSVPLAEAWPRAAALEYQAEEVDYWKSPHETERDGGGDCEDLAIFLIYLLGEDAYFIGIDQPGVPWDHAIVEYHGQYLEPHSVGVYFDPEIVRARLIERYSYAAIMAYATHGGTMAVAYSEE
jgi:hypothetical protein